MRAQCKDPPYGSWPKPTYAPPKMYPAEAECFPSMAFRPPDWPTALIVRPNAGRNVARMEPIQAPTTKSPPPFPPSPLQNPPKRAFGSTLCPQSTKKQTKRKCCVAKKKQVMQKKETKNTDPIRTTHPRPTPPNHPPPPPFKTDQNELLAPFCARKNHGGGGRARSLYATPPPPGF